jgi:hypothetical protein
MVGYPHIDKIVYDVFNKVMGQVEGGSLVVQKGREGKRRNSESRNQKRDLNICEGLEEALKLAKVHLPLTNMFMILRQILRNLYEPQLKRTLIPPSQSTFLIFIYLFNLQFTTSHHQVHHLHLKRIVHPPQLPYPRRKIFLLMSSTWLIQSIISSSVPFHKDFQQSGYGGRMTRKKLPML